MILVDCVGRPIGYRGRRSSAVPISRLRAADDTLVASIEEQGGHVVRDAKGNIVEVSLARTWATDADIERVAGIKTLKRLDLSLTYVSDGGAERLQALTQLEELNLFTAEFITDAAMAFLRGNTQLGVAEPSRHRRHRHEPRVHRRARPICDRSTSALRRSPTSAWSIWRRSRSSKS